MRMRRQRSSRSLRGKKMFRRVGEKGKRVEASVGGRFQGRERERARQADLGLTRAVEKGEGAPGRATHTLTDWGAGLGRNGAVKRVFGRENPSL